jgi:hypothetical protein
MKALHALYHLVRADFLERARRYSFLLVLGAVIYLGYLVASGRFTVWLGAAHRGVYNSAWVGVLMTMTSLSLMLFAGFYVVKNTLERDRRTGVGEIVASTPVTKRLYIVGKVLSNLAVFLAMMVVLVLVAVGAQLVQGEETRIVVWPLLSPFLLIWLPAMGTVAAMAVLFETLPGLRGGWGNVVYFFLLMTLISGHLILLAEHATDLPFADLIGYGLMESVLADTLGSRIPGYDGSLQIGATGDLALQPVRWEGIPWTPERVLARLYWFGVAFVLVLVAAVCFSRFDPARGFFPHRRFRFVDVWVERVNRWHGWLYTALSTAALKAAGWLAAAWGRLGLVPKGGMPTHSRFGRTLRAELRLMLKGQRWWWYLVALGLIVAGLTGDQVRHEVLPYAWLWPLLVWSAMGVLETRHRTEHLVFSAPHPLSYQLPATWLAGVVVAVLAGSGVLVRLLLDGDWVGIGAWLAGGLFIPTLALALGCWSGNSKLFEVVYTILWYAGPVEGIAVLDFMGASGGSVSCTCSPVGATFPVNMPLITLAWTVVLLALAFVGRRRHITGWWDPGGCLSRRSRSHGVEY